MIYETFLQSLTFWYLIYGRLKISFFIFYCFKDLQELKKLRDFYSFNILSREVTEALESHKGSHGAQTRHGARPTYQTAPPRPVWPSSVASAPYFYDHIRLVKNIHHIFLEFSKAEAEPFFYLQKG
jgi:hypothetical protein